MSEQQSTRRSRKLAVGLVIAVTVALGCAATATAAPDAAGVADRASDRESPLYWSTIRTTIAQAFHRTPRQLASLWAAGTKGGSKRSDPIAAYATQHGMRIVELRALELRAMQRAYAALVQQHLLTRTEASKRLGKIRGASQRDLDGFILEAFQPGRFP